MSKKKRSLNERETGLTYKNHSYMVAGYLSDYKLTYDTTLKEVTGKGGLTVKDFKENRGYVDDKNMVHIYRENPDKSELIPWFTVVQDENGEPVLKFADYESDELKEAFSLDRVADLSIANIIKNSQGELTIYDKEMLDEMMNAASRYVPTIKDKDDFLKKLIKSMLLEKKLDAHSFKKYMEHSYQISNLIQGLNSDTKTSPFVFETWMALGCCSFTLTIHDSGIDPYHKIDYDIEYDSDTNRIRLVKEGKEYVKNPETDTAVSSRQFS